MHALGHNEKTCSICAEKEGREKADPVLPNGEFKYQWVYVGKDGKRTTAEESVGMAYRGAVEQSQSILDKEKYPNIAELIEGSIEMLAKMDQEVTRAKEVLETTRAISDERAGEIAELANKVLDLESKLETLTHQTNEQAAYWTKLKEEMQAKIDLQARMLETAAKHGVDVNEYLGACIDWTKVSAQYEKICTLYKIEWAAHTALKDAQTGKHIEAFNSGRAYERKLARQKKAKKGDLAVSSKTRPTRHNAKGKK
jgi:hypothetical protein